MAVVALRLSLGRLGIAEMRNDASQSSYGAINVTVSALACVDHEIASDAVDAKPSFVYSRWVSVRLLALSLANNHYRISNSF
jgi:hypothetical protein